EIPSAGNIRQYVRAFNLANPLVDEQYHAAIDVAEAFPLNRRYRHVFLKANLVNGIFRTAIRDVAGVAKHLYEKVENIDTRLRRGDPALVEDIAKYTKGGTTRRNYSFATKYCHCHQPGLFPIYDENVRISLFGFNRHHGFAHFTRAGLRDYATFLAALENFKMAFECTTIDNGTLDRFLWALGRKVAAQKRRGNMGDA
ncbi:MAG TPA: hypothetical protein VHC50_00965, partial [Puia sp.]|nr:hypothetical protein [Puia sp.]